jgi:hypothetical protein
LERLKLDAGKLSDYEMSIIVKEAKKIETLSRAQRTGRTAPVTTKKGKRRWTEEGESVAEPSEGRGLLALGRGYE